MPTPLGYDICALNIFPDIYKREMIRRDKNGGWILITQHDHSILSGQIMTHWGNEEFAKPEPLNDVLFAVRDHDCGWKDWDSHPKVNPETGYPANFTEMSFKDQGDIWRKSYSAFSEAHPYASSLIALHFAKFNRNNLRKEPGNEIAESLQKEMKLFVAENLNIEIVNGSLEKIPEEVRINLKLLQIGDIVSLTLCHGWKSIEITEVPLDYSGSETTLKMESEDGLNYTIAPYPFDEAGITFVINGRSLEQKVFTDDDELGERLNDSGSETLDFTIAKG